jgi:ribonuclease-3
MTMSHPWFELEQRLGYRFRNIAYLEQALTHSSKNGSNNNERMEFLGDRVLNLVMAHALFEQFPDESEGSLAKKHSSLVQGKMLAAVGITLNIPDFLIMSEAEREAGGADNENIVSDATEALLGAVYLDGGLEPARTIITKLWDKYFLSPSEMFQDSKTELQEWVQARGLPLPDYEIVGRTGPDHAPVFEVEVRVEGQSPVLAVGASRRQAEKEAARRMLIQVKPAA